MTHRIGTLDLAVIATYLLGFVAVGCYAGLKRRQEGEANRYFLAAHSLRWPSIGMALFATNISCLHLVSLAQAGYDSGLLMGNNHLCSGRTALPAGLDFQRLFPTVARQGVSRDLRPHALSAHDL